jgi:PAS domain-containing protein
VLDASSLEEGDQCVDRREQEGDHILIYANRPFEELTGYDEDEIL